MALPAGTRVLVGVDLVQVSQVALVIARLGSAYTQRIWTTEEIAYCSAQPEMAAVRFATAFAVKGATLKALRLGDEGLDLRLIAAKQMAGGWWDLELRGKAQDHAHGAGWQSSSLSLSQEGDYAIAVVTVLVLA